MMYLLLSTCEEWNAKMYLSGTSALKYNKGHLIKNIVTLTKKTALYYFKNRNCISSAKMKNTLEIFPQCISLGNNSVRVKCLF